MWLKIRRAVVSPSPQVSFLTSRSTLDFALLLLYVVCLKCPHLCVCRCVSINVSWFAFWRSFSEQFTVVISSHINWAWLNYSFHRCLRCFLLGLPLSLMGTFLSTKCWQSKCVSPLLPMSESCPRPSCCYNDINISDAALRCWVQMAKIIPHSWQDEMTIKWSSRMSKSHPLYLLFFSLARKTLAHCQSQGCKRHQATILSTDVVESLNSHSCVWFYLLVQGLYQICFLIHGNKPLTLLGCATHLFSKVSVSSDHLALCL